MDYRLLTESDKTAYNKLVSHFMQSWQWGQFRADLGTKVLRFGLFNQKKMVSAFQMTLHQIPLLNQYIGYLPKGPFPDYHLAEILTEIGKKYHCAAIKIEPDVQSSEFMVHSSKNSEIDRHFIKSPHPLFTKYNYLLDLNQSEEKILQNMHPKFRYNIKVAQKHGVYIEERTDDMAFEIYLKLLLETTKRQKFYSHTASYHRLVWQTLNKANMARLLIAFYKSSPDSEPLPLASWMLVIFKESLYYPYGGSSEEFKHVMASNLVAWEAIKLGKKLKLTTFDLWGALGPQASPNDPWQGFSRFKGQTGAKLVEYLGTYDLILNPLIYWPFTFIDHFTALKVFLLKIIRHG